MKDVEGVVGEHPYFRNRYTLSALTIASKFENNLAKLILVLALKYLSLTEKEKHELEQFRQVVRGMLHSEENFGDFYGVFKTLLITDKIEETSFPHFYVLRGHSNLKNGYIPEALRDFKKAEEMGDFEGCIGDLSLVQDPREYQRLVFKAFWMGKEEMYQKLQEYEKNTHEKHGRIFKLIKKLYTQIP